MAAIDVTDEWTSLTDGTETTDTVVTVGKDMRVAIGDTTDRTYANASPMAWGQVVIVPAGVVMSAITSGGTWPAWVETGFSA
jgi:hypothetical protein